jgi:glycosyltransferase involved in cell wall biosynthesis
VPPLVSVVIPAHDGEKYLAQAIESVLGQDYPCCEILVVDNASTDRTGEIAARYARVRCVRTGIADVNRARNRGIELAQGDFIAFLDQDDAWFPQKLGRQMNFLESNPDHGAVVSLQRIFLEEGCEKPHWLKRSFLERPQPAYLPSALLARRAALEATGRFDTAYARASDADWFFKARHGGVRVGLLDEVLVHRRIHGENTCRHARDMQAELLEIIKASLARRREAKSECPE